MVGFLRTIDLIVTGQSSLENGTKDRCYDVVRCGNLFEED
jgi:hypothetical protein